MISLTEQLNSNFIPLISGLFMQIQKIWKNLFYN